MNIVVAPDSFKECLTASQVAWHIATGIRNALPEARVVSIPIADGGEGTVEALVTATGGHVVEVDTVDALMRPVRSFYGILGDGRTAVVEMAAASGIGLIHPAERNPMITSTYGTGLLLKKVIGAGFRDIILGIGGSATNDGGMGMARALGYQFLSNNGKEVPEGGGSLKLIDRIDTSRVDPKLGTVRITVACDVVNPLCGPQGASAVFGPQKGATPSMVSELDENLLHFAGLIQKELGRDVANVPGAGAAGGLGAGLLAFTPATLKPGFGIVKEITGLEQQIRDADLVFTAEGKIDFQTQFGKTPFGVAQIALQYGKPVIALAGSVGDGAEALLDKGITAYFGIADKPMTLEESVKDAGRLLENTSQQVMRLVLQSLLSGK